MPTFSNAGRRVACLLVAALLLCSCCVRYPLAVERIPPRLALPDSGTFVYLGPPQQPGFLPPSITTYEVDFAFKSRDFGRPAVTLVVQLLQ